MPSTRTLLVSAVFTVATTLSPAALAKCPKSVAGVWSGLLKLDSFQDGGGHTDQSFAVIRLSFAANGTYRGTLAARNSAETVGEASSEGSGTYTFSAGTCSGELDIDGSEYRFVATNNGSMLMGILFRPRDTTQLDSAAFTLYRE